MSREYLLFNRASQSRPTRFNASIRRGVGWQKLQPAVSIGNAACHLIENVETFEYAA